MSDRINEELIKNSTITEIDTFIYDVCKSICKISILNKVATGFLIKLFKKDVPLYCLMTNEHVITTDMIDNQQEMEIYYDNEKEKRIISLNKEKRIIRDYKFLNIDAIIVEILDKDNIKEDLFLLPSLDYINDFDDLINNKKICIFQFPKGEKLSYSYGIIKSITQYEFTHLASTKNGSSGSPILISGIPKVIGIHKQAKKDGTENYGDFIGPIVETISKDLEFEYKIYENGIYEGEVKDKKREGYGKYIFNDGNYYIGQFHKGLREGKGADYYKNNNIMHEGEFVQDLLEGNGKFYDKDGSYYIGQFSKMMKHGKGTDYYRNDKIQYEGDYVMGKRHGKGKYIWLNGDYYEGEFLNGLFHGMGTEYYANGNIKYQGEFRDDKYEGNGKYIFEEGNYYIGQFSKGFQNGKGTLFYKDGTIEFEGEFKNDEKEGYGKYIWENGDYYIGNFSKGEMNGKGIEYYKNNTIKYNGEFYNNLYQGNGELHYENGNYYIGEFAGGMRHGNGKLYNKNGTIRYEGEFIKGKFYQKMNTVA